MSMSRSSRVTLEGHDYSTATAALAGSGIALHIASMFGSLVRWVPCVFLFALAMKFWMEPRGYRLRFATPKLTLAMMGLFAIFASYGSLKGVEPSISLLVVLVSLKILEAHTAREFQVMALMGWVLCLCSFFLSQDFVTGLSLLTAFALLLVALIQFYRGSSPGAFWPRWGRHAKSGLSGPARRPLVRFVSPNQYWLTLSIFARAIWRALDFRSISPGSIAALANSSEIAFRAEFPGIPRRHPVRCIGVAQSCGIAMAWNGARRTCRYQSLPAAAGPGNCPKEIQFASGLRSPHMAHAGCLRSIGLLKFHPVRSLRVAIISRAFRQFERCADMKSFRLSEPLEKN